MTNLFLLLIIHRPQAPSRRRAAARVARAAAPRPRAASRRPRTRRTRAARQIAQKFRTLTSPRGKCRSRAAANKWVTGVRSKPAASPRAMPAKPRRSRHCWNPNWQTRPSPRNRRARANRRQRGNRRRNQRPLPLSRRSLKVKNRLRNPHQSRRKAASVWKAEKLLVIILFIISHIFSLFPLICIIIFLVVSSK